MKHARPDYDHIQDHTGLIPEDEPVLLLRGQDIVAPYVLREYAAVAREKGAGDDIIGAVLRQADAMELWQAERACKIPDLPAVREGAEL